MCYRRRWSMYNKDKRSGTCRYYNVYRECYRCCISSQSDEQLTVRAFVFVSATVQHAFSDLWQWYVPSRRFVIFCVVSYMSTSNQLTIIYTCVFITIVDTTIQYKCECGKWGEESGTGTFWSLPCNKTIAISNGTFCYEQTTPFSRVCSSNNHLTTTVCFVLLLCLICWTFAPLSDLCFFRLCAIFIFRLQKLWRRRHDFWFVGSRALNRHAIEIRLSLDK